MFDRDDNGYITRDELRSALEMIGEPVTDAQLNQVLALGDIDHDGRIDYEGTNRKLTPKVINNNILGQLTHGHLIRN